MPFITTSFPEHYSPCIHIHSRVYWSLSQPMSLCRSTPWSLIHMCPSLRQIHSKATAVLVDAALIMPLPSRFCRFCLVAQLASEDGPMCDYRNSHDIKFIICDVLHVRGSGNDETTNRNPPAGQRPRLDI